MRICIVNYRYFVSSGPERYMFGVTDLLEERGHEVVPFSVRYSRNEPTPWARYFVPPIAREDEILFRQHSWTASSARRALARTFYSREVYDAFSRQLRTARPDVAYVLKYLRKMSPAVLTALHDHGVPIVVRLSDFGMVCPQEHLVRADQVCDLCVGRGLLPSVRYRCVQSSFAASAVNALAMTWANRKGFFGLADAIVTPSNIMRQKMIEGGTPATLLHHLPTFVKQHPARPYAERERRVCYAGRIEHIKGLDVLLDAFELLRSRGQLDDVELMIAGDLSIPPAAPIVARLRQRPIAGVSLVGHIDESGVTELLQSSMVSVVPSVWYENSPNALLESLACGTPVIASDLGSMRETLCGTGAGILFPAGDHQALADALHIALTGQGLEKMGQRAQALVRQRHSPAAHADALVALFERVTARRH